MSASFTDPKLVRARDFSARRGHASPFTLVPDDTVASAECRDALEVEARQQDIAIRRAHGHDASVKMAFLRWENSAELVLVVKTAAKDSRQLHFPIINGALVYGDGESFSSVRVDGDAEALAPFVEVLRRDVAAILSGAAHEVAKALLPPAPAPKFPAMMETISAKSAMALN